MAARRLMSEKSARLAKDLVRLPKLTVLPFQSLEARKFVAGRTCPVSRSSRRTHLRNASAVQPNFGAIDCSAAHCEA